MLPYAATHTKFKGNSSKTLSPNHVKTDEQTIENIATVKKMHHRKFSGTFLSCFFWIFVLPRPSFSDGVPEGAKVELHLEKVGLGKIDHTWRRSKRLFALRGSKISKNTLKSINYTPHTAELGALRGWCFGILADCNCFLNRLEQAAPSLI